MNLVEKALYKWIIIIIIFIIVFASSLPRDQPKIINIRNFNKFNERNFQSDIARAPFQVCEVFDDPTDVYYAWNLLFTELCNEHAPLKQIKVRSNSLPWIIKEIRITLNQRYKTLKRARQLNDPQLWDDYRKKPRPIINPIYSMKQNWLQLTGDY